jgi:hypothetical protein
LKVFVSWSGTRSKAVAVALQKWLSYIAPDVLTWLSSEDIGADVPWGPELLRELDSANFGILCLTPENLNAPWLLFAAGALWKSLQGSSVIPYSFRFAVNEIAFPLAQFQGVSTDETGTRALLRSINRLRQHSLTDDDLNSVFSKWWPGLKTALDAIPDTADDFVFLPSGIANPELFARYYQLEVTASNTRLAQLKDGYLQIFSREVEQIEADVFAYMAAGGLNSILCVDVTSEPAIPLSGTRAKSRAEFIRKGGSIKRVLVVDETQLRKGKYLTGLLEVEEAERRIGVQLGLSFLADTGGELWQDFTLYDGFGVLLERRQADSAYDIGASVVDFKQRSLDQYKRVFTSFWDGREAMPPAPNVLDSFMDYIRQYPRTKGSLGVDYPRFRNEVLGKVV